MFQQGMKRHDINIKLHKQKAKKENLPFPPLQITALESPTFATKRRSPTSTAVEAVEPASLF